MLYIFIGLGLLTTAISLYLFNISAGFQYLSIGFFMFFIYTFGKGCLMYIVSNKRLNYFINMTDLGSQSVKEEIQYSAYRINKKKTSRRIYIYTTVICSIIAFAGIFSPYKSIMMGTAIPIALISGIEFSIGLLTEFRLKEYHRVLEKKR
ncbi:MAG: hypothetical protein IPL55_21310 [Saprospiraceae bacterium]|nr:hypothetical protein [Saprospiraceae bacterium]